MNEKKIRAIGMVARIREKNLYLYRNSAVTDIFIACHDNLTGFCDAINAIFPKTKNQLCIVHQIRNSCKFVPYKDRKAVCADLKKIYGAVNLDDAEYAKEEFREKWDKKYPDILKSWDKNWSELTTFFDISNTSYRAVRDSEDNIYYKCS